MGRKENGLKSISVSIQIPGQAEGPAVEMLQAQGQLAGNRAEEFTVLFEQGLVSEQTCRNVVGGGGWRGRKSLCVYIAELSSGPSSV